MTRFAACTMDSPRCLTWTGPPQADCQKEVEARPSGLALVYCSSQARRSPHRPLQGSIKVKDISATSFEGLDGEGMLRADMSFFEVLVAAGMAVFWSENC